MGYAVGVDLGTSFVSVAAAQGSQAWMISVGEHKASAPSVVYRHDDGTVVSGEVAYHRSASSPDRSAQGFKRRLGEQSPVFLGGRPQAVADLLAIQLKSVLRQVTEAEGAPPELIVLTRPSSWGAFRCALFDDVPARAGCSDALIVTEPEAVVAHYSANRRTPDESLVAVYDLGGGIFDSAVLRTRAGRAEILGNPEGFRLGGIDFDDALMDLAIGALGGALTELGMRDLSTAALGRLRRDCVTAKELLSSDTAAALSVFVPGRHREISVTREGFEELVHARIEATLGALKRALRSAAVGSDQLDDLLLVGGSSHIPLVSQLASDLLGRSAKPYPHARHAVALGAAELGAARLHPPGPGRVQRHQGDVRIPMPVAQALPRPAPAPPPPPHRPSPPPRTEQVVGSDGEWHPPTISRGLVLGIALLAAAVLVVIVVVAVVARVHL